MEPEFQIFECSNPDCRLRLPSDLSFRQISTCPACSSEMIRIGEPFSNFHRPPGDPNQNTYQIHLLLDNLRSTENVGSIFRSANGAGVRHIYCCGTTPTPDHAKVRKSSLGAELYTDWSYHKNSLALANKLLLSGFIFYALESTSSSTSIFKFRPAVEVERSIVMIVGNEISGIDPGLIDLAQQVLHIPMAGEKTSLNVAVSTGIALYYMLQRSNHISATW